MMTYFIKPEYCSSEDNKVFYYKPPHPSLSVRDTPPSARQAQGHVHTYTAYLVTPAAGHIKKMLIASISRPVRFDPRRELM